MLNGSGVLPCTLPRGYSLLLLTVVSLATIATAQTVTLSPTNLSFGSVVVGTSSPARTVSLTNTGTATLSITSITTSGNFLQTNNCGRSVAAGKKCSISVTFTPSATGTANGTLTITDNASNSPQTVSLSGTGVTAVSLSPTALTFASRTVGTTSNPLSVTVTNNQSSSLSITSVSVSGDFAETNTCGTTLAAKGKCTVSVTFTPTVVGLRTGTLTLVDSASNSPQTVSLTGTGSTAGLLSIAVAPANPSVLAGQTQQFTATGTFSGGGTYNLTQSVTWSSSKQSIATVSNSAGTQGLATALAAGSSTIRATSNNVTGSTTLTVTSPVTLVSIALTPANPTIAKGNTQQFTATGTYSDGSTQDLTGTATWSSSQTSVATVAVGGLATGTGVGSSSITATSGTVSGSTMLNVSVAALVSIAVTPANAWFALGTTQQMTATGTYSDGSTLNLTSTVTWTTADQTIATINNQGVASSLAVGSTTVTAAQGPISGSTTVTVTSATLVSIAVTPAIPSIAARTTLQFTATGTYTDNSVQNITTTVQWSSDTPAVATISNGTGTQGLATGMVQGTATISATLGTITGSTVLTVTDATLVSIAMIPANPSIAAGTTQPFTATGTYSDGSTQNLTTAATWTSDTPSVATISNAAGNAGLATSVAPGTATISATSGSITGSTVLTVTSALLVSIAINPPTATIPLGTTQQFTATGTYNDGSTQDLTQTGSWMSTVLTVATISDTSGTMGLATSAGVGTTTINLTSGSVLGSATLVVNPASLVSIAVAPQNATIDLGAQQQFTATSTYTDGTMEDLTSVATWSSSNETVAVISNTLGTNGLATSSGQGTATITAAAGSITSPSSMLTVIASGPTLTSITVTPATVSIPLGTTQQFTATGNYSDGSTQNLTSTVMWSSSAIGVATISNAAGMNGLATAAGVGTATITAAIGSVSASTMLSVTGAVVSLLPSSLTFANQVVGTTSTAQIVTLSNTGNASLNLTSVVASGNYGETNTCGSSLAAGSSCSISVTFTPTTTGTLTGSVTLTDNASNSPQMVSLTGTGQPANFQHVIVIVQENRTPDNLFQGLCSSPFGTAASCSTSPTGSQYDIQTSNWLDKTSSTGVTQPTSVPLSNGYDLGHTHLAFTTMCDMNALGVCQMDGAAGVTCSGTCTTQPQYKYVDNSTSILNPYLTLATEYGWANYMFQTNQGPSFPSHQFLFGGTSAPSAADDVIGTFAAENVNPNGSGAGCIAPAGTIVKLITPQGEVTSIYPCFDHETMADLFDSLNISWKYYTESKSSIWTAPNAIQHICVPSSPTGGSCTGSDWTNNVIINPPQVLTDIGKCSLAQVNWVIPTGQNSDHPRSSVGGGPSWVASVVNAIGNNPPCNNGELYWDNTAILITWDDWGGWYDHEPPNFLTGAQGDYQYGFRVPFIVVSAYTAAGYVDNNRMDFGSILRFIEQNFGIAEGSLNFADARSSTDLTEFFDLQQVPRPFQTIAAPLDANYFLNDKTPPTDPDDD